MRAILGAVCVALLAGMAPARAAGCDARAAVPWSAAPGTTLQAEAYALGATCANAVVVVIVRAGDGKPLWVDTRVAAQVMTFAGITEKAAMSRALGEWIAQGGSQLAHAGKLPDWSPRADAPSSGEFPFYPESDVDREMYMRIRSERQPLFCYVQGMESMACVALSREGDMTKVGVQSFPG